MPALGWLPLPLWCACGRRQTCPEEASAAPPCARSPGCAPPGVELPCRSPRGHIPPSEPAALLLLGACPHSCTYSASNNSEGKSTCSHKLSFMPSPSPPGAAQCWSVGRGSGDDSSLIWHGGAELTPSPPAASQQASSLPGSLAQVGTSWVPPLSLGFLRGGASLERSKETCESPHSPLTPSPLAPPPTALTSQAVIARVRNNTKIFWVSDENTKETVNWGTCLTFPSSFL